tara:strand:- start:52 stop:1068 length:1017 start_codon:yes stop_codon:yes gene_type:complete
MSKNLYQRGGVYYARLQVSGAERRVSLKTTDRREAERRLKVFLTENSPYHGTIRRSFDDVVGDFLDEASSRLKPKTIKRYEVSAIQLGNKFSGKWWDGVTKRAVVEYIDERKADGVKIPTIRRDLTVLSQAAEWAMERGIGGANPVDEIGKRQLRYKKPTFVRPNEQSIEATINAAYGNLTPLARFLRHSGMRLDEAATLRLESVDRARKVATLFDTKNRRSRAVTLSDEALACLPDHGEYAFPSRTGEPYRQASTNWQEAKARARKTAQKEGWRYTPFRLHDLRHIYAIEYLANGGNLYALQRQLGHGTIRQTEEYLQYLSPEEARLAVDRSAQIPA